MCSKLTAIVRSDGLDGSAIGKELLYHRPGNRFRLFACPYALHQQHIGAAFHKCQYHVLSAIHNQVHLPIAETGAVGFFRTVVDTGPVGDIGGFGYTLFLLPAPVAQFMRHMFCQFSRFIRMHVIINGFWTDMDALFGEYTAYLTGRPLLVFYLLFHMPPQDVVFAVIAQSTVFATLAFLLGNGENLLVVAVGVALHLARYG